MADRQTIAACNLRQNTEKKRMIVNLMMGIQMRRAASENFLETKDLILVFGRKLGRFWGFLALIVYFSETPAGPNKRFYT